jgi:hypothetical protein
MVFMALYAWNYRDGGGVTAFRVRMELYPSSWAYPERHLYCNPAIQYSH